jgi:hypothetical protein
MCECFEVAHPVKVDIATQVIEFVLNDPREEAFGSQLNSLTVAIQRVDAKFSPARNTAPKIRDAEASFPVLDTAFIQDRYVGIHEHSHWNVAARTMTFDDGDC